ncbi:MAG: hypothetical protein EZS28_048103 [Streblomastix strix]|uniref:Tyr recombinase domain-containing protein n=1 Tax=Streblomastix strix TaxID=222440 RepID=A0A5J4TFE5_9EUKA|nr:MAG: hypothetical protein EZS28_048103 [Streblomastix strix]
MARDGLLISWENQTPLLHPPIPLLLRTIRKVKEDLVMTAVIIAPKWPDQYWYTELLEITELMITLGQSEQVLIPGERQFRFLLEDYGLKQAVVQRIVEAWHEQWRVHFSALSIVVKYLEENNQQWKELQTLEQPSVLKANFIQDQMGKGASDNSLKSCRGALAVFFSFKGYKEEQAHSKLIAQQMKPVQMRTRHKDREIVQWDLNILLEQIIKEQVELLRSNLSIEETMTITLTLCMIFTVARLAELLRATLINETEKEITLETVILNKPSRIIELKIKKALDQRICQCAGGKHGIIIETKTSILQLATFGIHPN